MQPPEPWDRFLNAIDAFVSEEFHFHCLGGFVVTQLYGSPRSTSDLDFLTMIQKNDDLIRYGGLGSELHKKYGVYLDPVGITLIPDNYAERMKEMYSGNYERLRLFAMDPYDIVLSKLERNSGRDREDVEYLARAEDLDLAILRKRYIDEVRYQVKNESREDQTLGLWIEMIDEYRHRPK